MMEKVKRSIFKAYDIRGLVPEDLDPEAAYHIARAFVSIAKCKTCVIARDMRLSGEDIARQLVRGCTDQGCDVYDIGLSSTPLYYYAVNKLEADGGIMVTASHNPKEYNGMKIVLKGAVPAVGVIDNDDLWSCANYERYDDPATKGSVLDHDTDLVEGYCDAVIKTTGVRNLKGLKIAVDCGNGMAGKVLFRLFEKLGNEPVRLYWRPDGAFPNHAANPLNEDTLLDLKEAVVDNKCDIGIAYDGDADRVGFVDETGSVVPGDFITALIGCELLKTNPGKKIMYDLRSSWSVRDAIADAGGVPQMCRVGHGPIKTQMRAEDGYFAGELSSHYYFSEFFVTDNGDLAMLYIIRMLLSSGKTLSSLAAPLKKYYKTKEINSKVKDTKAVLERLEKEYGPKAKAVYRLDGFSAEFDDWWFNVRASNTEPLIRLNLEAKSPELMNKKSEELIAVIRE